MKPRLAVLIALLCAAPPAFAQTLTTSTLNVSGEAAVTVVPDRVRLFLGVESRNQSLLAAKTDNDAGIRRVIDAARALNVPAGDIQTDYMRVEMSYQSGNGTIVDYYKVTKDVQILVRDVQQFEQILSQVLVAGANHIYDVDFSTSELRKHRDAARALAMKAAQEKASDLASAAGLRVVGAPLSINTYSYSGGASYGRWHSRGYGQVQNVLQNTATANDGIGADGTVALGKINVTASVSMTFQVQP
jgi:uncharacterized protein YggE